jgi:tetrapyrrole methylase family protein/MazG family protein
LTPSRLVIAGLGPGPWERVPAATKDLLLDPQRTVVVRTLEHPAAAHLGGLRPVLSCDDLYRQAPDFEAVYREIADRVLTSAKTSPTVYAVPGSPLVGELAVGRLRSGAEGAGIELEVEGAESFLDALLWAVGYDPLDRGLRLLNGHSLPEPLVIDSPTVVAQLDHPVVLAEVTASLQRVLPEETVATLVVGAGAEQARLVRGRLEELDPRLAGQRTSLFVDPVPGGLVGVVQTMRRLREECPWDRSQTHESLVKNLIEEAFELVEALVENHDRTSYGAVEDELGDLLLQVLFHSTIARQEGAFDITDVAENLRRKLVRRHPHVFGQVVADTAEEVKANWELIKEAERGGVPTSALDGVPAGMPALERAAKLQRRAATVGFDWPDPRGVVAKLAEELEELGAVLADPQQASAELGDLLFTVVNLCRHLRVEPEVALRGAINRFVARFRRMEESGPLSGMTPAELDDRWEQAKRDLQFPG